MQNPYEPPQMASNDTPAERPGWRLIALLVTGALVLGPGAFFTLMLNTPVPRHVVFLKFLSGPFSTFWLAGPFGPAKMGSMTDLIGAASVALMLSAFTLYPRWYTLILTLLGAVCWFACGLVEVTGGV